MGRRAVGQGSSKCRRLDVQEVARFTEGEIGYKEEGLLLCTRSDSSAPTLTCQLASTSRLADFKSLHSTHKHCMKT